MVTNGEQAVALLDHFLEVYAEEAEATKRLLLSIPEEDRHYRPHPRSRSALELAWHIASSEVWFLEGIIAGAFGERLELPSPEFSLDEVETWYRLRTQALLRQVLGLRVCDFTEPIEFEGGIEHPAVTFFHQLLRHTAHHRGQLTVYLRMMGCRVPQVCGETADESSSVVFADALN
jgi:uncharacterized damage-inducible protein DinB